MDLDLSRLSSNNILPFPISTEDFQKNVERPLFTGPLSHPMWSKVSSLGSNYPDNFDWTIYDNLFSRFGEKQPKGGVVFKQNFKLVNHHSTCSKCHYSFEIDTYGRGCVHNCTYCYAMDTLMQRGQWNRPMPFPIDLAEVRKIFYTVFETNKKNKWREILEKRIPVRIGSMSDSFMWMDRKYKVSYELLKILKHYRYPYIIFTRSDLIAQDEYLKVLDKDLASVQFSISGSNEELTKIIEPGAPSVKRRLEALKKISENDILTAVRINPLFPTYPDGYFSERESLLERFGPNSIPKLELFDIDNSSEFIDRISEAKVATILAGFVRLSSSSINLMSKTTGIDFRAFFKPEVLKGNGNGHRHFSDSEIGYYYRKIHRECLSKGIRFSTCYIGNGIKDYYNYQDLWANKTGDCCDARGFVPSFQKTAQDIPWENRIKHAADKTSATRGMTQELAMDALMAKAQVADNVLDEEKLFIPVNLEANEHNENHTRN